MGSCKIQDKKNVMEPGCIVSATIWQSEKFRLVAFILYIIQYLPGHVGVGEGVE
jgi:hypothetical protein